MVGLLFSVVINESIYRNFDRMAVFRFHHYYVNSLVLLIYCVLLHKLQSRWIPRMMKSLIFRH
jgi:hypothetical protein